MSRQKETESSLNPCPLCKSTDVRYYDEVCGEINQTGGKGTAHIYFHYSTMIQCNDCSLMIIGRYKATEKWNQK